MPSISTYIVVQVRFCGPKLQNEFLFMENVSGTNQSYVFDLCNLQQKKPTLGCTVDVIIALFTWWSLHVGHHPLKRNGCHTDSLIVTGSFEGRQIGMPQHFQ